MNILAFDTSSSACSVALQNGDNINVLHQIAPMQQAHLILPMIQELFSSASLAPNSLDAIAYGCGPGSFTGIRISSSVAQGMGFALQKPVIPVSSLAALAQTAFLEQQWFKLIVALDARMGKIYWASYEVNAAGIVELIGNEQIGTPDEMAQAVRHPEAYGIGDGWEIYKETLNSRLGLKDINATLLPSAKALLQLAKTKWEQGEWVAASEAVPVYLART